MPGSVTTMNSRGVAPAAILQDGRRRTHEVGCGDHVGLALGVHDHLRSGVLALQVEDLLQRELLVHVAGAVPQHHVRAAREALDIAAEVAVGGEEHGAVGRQRLHDPQGVGRRAADVGQRLHAHRRIDVGDHRVVGVAGPEAGELPGVARLGQRTPRSRAWGSAPACRGRAPWPSRP